MSSLMALCFGMLSLSPPDPVGALVSIQCGDTGENFLVAGLTGSGFSTLSYDDAGATLVDGLKSAFTCLKQDCEAGCNLSDRVTVEDGAGNKVKLTAPFDVAYWELGAGSNGQYEMVLHLPPGSVVSAYCTRCRD